MLSNVDDNTAYGAAERRRPTVLQVVPAMETGGVERGTVQIAAGLVQAGWRALVASSGGSMTGELQRVGAEHFELPLHRKGLLAIRKNRKRLAALIDEAGVDLLHARSRAPAWAGLGAARRAGIPFVTTFHSPYGDGIFKHWYNAVMAKGDHVIAISDFLAQHARDKYRVGEDRLTTVHRGVDLLGFSPENVGGKRIEQLQRAWRLPDGAFVVLLPGRLTRWKGQSILIDALAELGREDVVCVLVGSEQGRRGYRQELEERAEARDVAGQLRIVGHCNDMPAAYMLSDIVVSASTEPEGFGRVAIEAQALGRLVIASNHGGVRETVKPGVTGWLVAPGEPGALAGALRNALDIDEETRRAMADSARAQILEHFTADRMCAETLAIYSALLER